tara:strand:+ start:8933 stop:9685 length:753 start_codon:yes stop_codon:yes gene_type:complete
MSKYLIYVIRNSKNTNCYIGLTSKTVQERFEEHKERGKKLTKQYEIYEAMYSIGIEHFTIEELYCSPDLDHICKMEKHFITKYDSFNNGYNMNKGGIGLFQHTNITKQKMSENNYWRGKNRSGINNPMYGRKHTEEAKKKIQQSKFGNTFRLGKKHSEETRKKISKATIGRIPYNKGIPMSEETKKKLSESKKGTIRNTKKWLITHPDGKQELIENMSKYCKENNLSAGNMSSVASGKLNHYKGYLVQEA